MKICIPIRFMFFYSVNHASFSINFSPESNILTDDKLAYIGRWRNLITLQLAGLPG